MKEDSYFHGNIYPQLTHATISRPWINQFFRKNASQPYWTDVFTNVYKERAVTFVLPIYIDERIQKLERSNVTSLYSHQTPIEHLFGIVQFTLNFMNSLLRNISNHDEHSFIVNSFGTIIASTSHLFPLDSSITLHYNKLSQEAIAFMMMANEKGQHSTIPSSRLNQLLVKTAFITDEHGLNWTVVVVAFKRAFFSEILRNGKYVVVLYVILFVLEILFILF